MLCTWKNILCYCTTDTFNGILLIRLIKTRLTQQILTYRKLFDQIRIVKFVFIFDLGAYVA